MIAVARDGVPTCMRTVAALGTAGPSGVGLTGVGLSMWPATMIGRLALRAARRRGVARVAAADLRTMVVVNRRMRWAVMIGRPESAALRRTEHRPPSITIGRVVLLA